LKVLPAPDHVVALRVSGRILIPCFIRNGPAYRRKTTARQYVRFLFYLFGTKIGRVRLLFRAQDLR